MPEQKTDDFKHIIRIANTDLDGNKPVMQGLRKIRGIGFMFANMACSLAHVQKNKKSGYLTDGEVERLNEVITNPLKFNAPIWMLNRRKDYEDGKDKHLISSDIAFVQSSDIKLMKMIRCYKGVRHSFGLPVRGQLTKSNFRRNKGKVMGVKRRAGAKAGRT